MSEPRDDEPPDEGLFDPYDVSDEEMDEWLAEWDEADRQSVELLRQALADHVGLPAPGSLAATAGAARTKLAEPGQPMSWMLEAADLKPAQLPADDTELLIRLAAATISPQELTSLDDEEEATLASLQHADWHGAIAGATRGGAGSDVSPASLVEAVRTCPEIEDADELDADDAQYLETAFWIVTPPWHILGLTDADHRLTPLGEWVLPRALARAWQGDFDHPAAGAP